MPRTQQVTANSGKNNEVTTKKTKSSTTTKPTKEQKTPKKAPSKQNAAIDKPRKSKSQKATKDKTSPSKSASSKLQKVVDKTKSTKTKTPTKVIKSTKTIYPTNQSNKTKPRTEKNDAEPSSPKKKKSKSTKKVTTTPSNLEGLSNNSNLVGIILPKNKTGSSSGIRIIKDGMDRELFLNRAGIPRAERALMGEVSKAVDIVCKNVSKQLYAAMLPDFIAVATSMATASEADSDRVTSACINKRVSERHVDVALRNMGTNCMTVWF